MFRFYEPMFCCHWFVSKNKLLHKPCHHNPLLCNYRHHPRKNRKKRLAVKGLAVKGLKY